MIRTARAWTHCVRGLALLAAVALAANGPPANAELVGYWNFNEGSGLQANDSSGKWNMGLLSNMTGGEWQAGRTGSPGDYALHFDGANDHVRIPDSPSVSVTGNLTMSAWVNADAWAGAHRNIVAKHANEAYRWRVETSGQSWLLLNDGGGLEVFSSGQNVPAGAWHHVAATADFSTSQVRFWVDGTPTAPMSMTSTASIADTGGPLVLAAYNSSGAESFDGRVDEVAIWNQKLTDTQIQSLAAGTSPPAILGTAPPAPKGTMQFIPISGDADSEISTAKTYAHALDCGSGTVAAVNGVGLTLARTGDLPLANFNYQVAGGGLSEHGGGMDGNFAVTGNVRQLFRDMFYNGNNPEGSVATVTLSGLTPGAVYDTRLYARQWDDGSIRQATVGFDINGDGTPDNAVAVDQNHASSVGFGDDQQAYALSYRFKAESDHVDITLQQALYNASWHLYGVTNEIVKPAPGTAPVRALMTADNHYQLYLSADDNVLGTLIAQSGGEPPADWNTSETLGFLSPLDQTMYLHVVATNDDPPNWGGLIGQIQVPDMYRILETGSTELETNALLWWVNSTGYGNPMVAATAHGAYGIDPWYGNVNPGLPGTAEWIWLGPAQGQQAGTLYFSAPITIEYIPEPATMLLFGTGLLGLLSRCRRRRLA